MGCVSRERRISYLMSAAAMYVLSILAVVVCKIWYVCCLPAPAHQQFSPNSLGLSAPDEACSRNVRASGTLKCGYEGIFKISWNRIICLWSGPPASTGVQLIDFFCSALWFWLSIEIVFIV